MLVDCFEVDPELLHQNRVAKVTKVFLTIEHRILSLLLKSPSAFCHPADITLRSFVLKTLKF